MTRRSPARAALAAALAGLLALAAAMVLAAPAQATLFERFNFTFAESFEEDVCGIDVRIDTTVRGVIVARVGKHELDQAFLGHATFRYSDTFTNLATGASFTIEGRVYEGDVRGVHVEGNVFEFTGVNAGTERVVDDDGKVVLRDSGSIVSTELFDTLGDSQPGGILLDESIDRINGPHPLFEQDEDAFCAMVHELIG
jgi:hypothetical protein